MQKKQQVNEKKRPRIAGLFVKLREEGKKMIPSFDCKDSWAEWRKAVKTGVLKKSQVSDGVFKDLVAYNESCIFFKGHPEFKIEED